MRSGKGSPGGGRAPNDFLFFMRNDSKNLTRVFKKQAEMIANIRRIKGFYS